MTFSGNSLATEEGFTAERELVVIAKREAGLRASREGVASIAGADVTPLSSLLASEGISMEPLFGFSEEREQAQASSLAAETGEEEPDLSVYYKVNAPDERLDELAVSLRQLDSVEAAYVKPGAELAVATTTTVEAVESLNDMIAAAEEAPPATPNFIARQGYLDAAPEGIDARYAWTMSGGRGAGIGIVDIEGGWNFSNEDLLQNQGGVISGINSTNLAWRNHGTAVVGEIGGDLNSFGITGICPDAHVRAISIFGNSTAQAIRLAADVSKAGDIILIELHRPGPNATGSGQKGYIAIEWWPDDYAAIRYAVSRGVIVVEAAGNGAENFDDNIYNQRPSGFPAWWRNPLNPSNPSSGAVIVGAGAPPPGTHGKNHGADRSRLGFSNYGRRVDTQGWGREVTSTGYGDLQGGSNQDVWYTDVFSGTSSASPIVVGALGCVQGILRAQGLPLLTPARAISLLRSTGSPQQDAPGRPRTQRIGNRPNLRQLVAAIAKVWHYNKTVGSTYATSDSQMAWVFINTLGWRRIKTGSPDGVTNLHIMFGQALANNRKVHVYADNRFVYRAQLI